MGNLSPELAFLPAEPEEKGHFWATAVVLFCALVLPCVGTAGEARRRLASASVPCETRRDGACSLGRGRQTHLSQEEENLAVFFFFQMFIQTFELGGKKKKKAQNRLTKITLNQVLFPWHL